MVLPDVLFLCVLSSLVIAQTQDVEQLPPAAVARLGSGRLQHPVEIRSLAFSPDGLRLATLGERETVRLWDARTGVEERQFPAVDAFAVGFSKQGHVQVLRLSKDNVLWWDLQDDRELFRTPHGLGRTDTIRGLIRSESSVFAFTDGLAGPRVFRQGKMYDASGDKQWMWTLDVSPDGEYVAAGEEGVVRVWRTTGELVVQAKRHERNAWAVRFSPDGQTVASGGDKDLCLSDLKGKELWRIQGTSYVRSLAFAPDGKILAAGVGTAIHLFDAKTGAEMRKLAGHAETLMHLEFSPEGKRLASAERGCTAGLWEVATGTPIVERSGHQGRITSFALSPDGKRLATASVDQTARIWDLTTRKELLQVREPDSIGQVFFTPDGRTILTHGNAIRLWDAETGKPRPSMVQAEEAQRSSVVHLSPNGTRLMGIHDPMMVPGAGTMYVWDIASGKQLLNYSWSSRNELSATFSPDGSVLATSGGGDKVEIWDAATGRRLRDDITIERHWVTNLGFSPDGKSLAIATGTREKEPNLRLLNWRTGATLATFGKGDDFYVSSLSFSADGRLLATAGHDSYVRLWEVDSGSEIAAIHNPDQPWWIAFGSDSRTVLFGSYKESRVHDMVKEADVLRLPPGTYRVNAGGMLAKIDGASVLLYSVPRPTVDAKPGPLWEELKDTDAKKACRAMWVLGAAQGAPRLLQDCIIADCAPKEEKGVRELTQKLESDDIDARTQAFDKLVSYGEEIAPLLRKIRNEGLPAEARARVDALLERSSHGKSSRLLRRLRAIQALELSGDVGALKEILEKLPTEEERARVREAIDRIRP